MKNIKKILVSIMVGTLTFSAVSCSMIERTPESIGKTVLAKIDDEKITKADLDEQLQGYYKQAEAQYGADYENNPEAQKQLKELRVNMLNNLVDNKVLVMKAEELKLLSEDEIKKEMENARKEYLDYYGSEEELKKAIEAANISEEKFNEMLKEQVLATKAQEEMVKDVKVTDEEIKSYYEENKATYTTKPGANISHIIVKDEATAKEVSNKLKDGEKFEDLAKKYSTDGTAQTGGALGYIDYDTQQYDPDFMAAAKKLGEGEVSGVVKSQFGYHIIKVDGIVKEAKQKSLDESKEAIKATLENTKKGEAQKKAMEQWKKDLNVKLYEDRL